MLQLFLFDFNCIALSDNILSVILSFLQPREKGQMRFHMLHNIDTALHFLRCKNVKLVNIRSEDIVDGNPKLTLGLIWTIILHFQVSDAFFFAICKMPCICYYVM